MRQNDPRETIAAFQQKIFSAGVRCTPRGYACVRKAAPLVGSAFGGQGGAEPVKGDKAPRRLIYIASMRCIPNTLN